MRGPISVRDLGNKVLEFRREFGFSRRLPYELQNQVGELLASGVSAAEISRSIGVPRATVATWARAKLVLDPSKLKEIKIQSSDPSTEFKISKLFRGCRVEITGADLLMVQDLMKKIEAE